MLTRILLYGVAHVYMIMALTQPFRVLHATSCYLQMCAAALWPHPLKVSFQTRIGRLILLTARFIVMITLLPFTKPSSSHLREDHRSSSPVETAATMEEPAVQSFDPSLSISKAEIPPTSIVSASPLPVIEKETKPEIPVNVARMDQESIASDHVVEPSVEPAADRLSEVDRESLAAHDDPTSPVHTSDSSQITYQEEQDDEENDKMTQQQSDDKTAASSIQSSPLLEFDRRRSTTSDDQFQPLKTRLRPATQTEPISDTPLNRHVTLKPSVSVRLQTRIKKSGRRLTKLFKK